MKIAHLSDLHFFKNDWSISQLFCKRWLGNLNALFGRRSDFDHARLETLPSLFKSLGISLVIITGDLSTTSATAEFEIAKEYIGKFQQLGIEVLCIPGNHDHYTKEAYQNRHFYNYFPSAWDATLPYNLKEHGVTAKPLCPGWRIVGLDTACATSWVYSTGHFQPHIEKALDSALQNIHENVLLVNHFPFFQHESPRKILNRGPQLQKLVEKYPQIKMYCHGHTHRRCLAPLNESGLPLILDPGSTPHRKNGGWYLIDMNSQEVKHYAWKNNDRKNSDWTPNEMV